MITKKMRLLGDFLILKSKLMNKETFLKLIDDENDSTLKLFELIENAMNGKYVVSNIFYTPNIWMKIEKMNILSQDVGFLNIGQEDRRIFVSDKYNVPNDLVLIEIKNKFKQKTLMHKDYLGSLMSIGIERERFGDLFVIDDICYVFTFKKIADIVIQNLEKAGRNGLEVFISYDFDKVKNFIKSYDYFEILVPSLRLDAVVSEITKLSRNDSVSIIEKSQVSVNYTIKNSKSFELNIYDILTIRGFGKFKLSESLGLTKKLKEKIKVYRYN